MSGQAFFDLPGAPGFADGKEPEAFRTIGEVAKAFNLRQHVLRYWEEQFPMLRPLTRAGGRRYYRQQDVALIAEISRLLYREGFTIRGARQALAGWGKDKGEPAEALPAAVEAERAFADIPVAPAAPQTRLDPGLAGKLLSLRETLAGALK